MPIGAQAQHACMHASVHTYIDAPTYIQTCMHTCTHIHIYIYTYIYIYMVTPPPMNYRPSFCIVNTVSKQLFRQVRILYLSKTTENKPRTFQQDVSVNSFRFDVSTQSTATLCPPNQKPTFPRENQKTKKTSFETLCGQTPKTLFFWFSLGKRWFWTGKPTFS